MDPSLKTGDFKKRRIAVLTSGGDAPGMNGVVRAIVRMSIYLGNEVFAVHEGYEGLVAGGAFIRRMEWDDVRGWLSKGGTLIGSARSENFRHREGRLKAAQNMIERGIDALAVCGGDGSLTGADRFRGEWPGLLEELVEKKVFTKERVEPFRHLNIVGIVGSIDNDLSGTDATIGCYSSLHRICESVDGIFDTASSHQRGFVIEVMGRHCGWLALMSAISTGADWVFVPEIPPKEGWEDRMCDIISNNRQRGKRRTIVIIAEGAHDRNLNPISSNHVKDILKDRLKLDTRVTILGHTQRGGVPCFFDRWLSTLQGLEAVKILIQATPHTPSYIVTIHENKIERVPLMDAIKHTEDVTNAIKAKDFDRAIALRDAEFKAYHRAYINITTPHHPTILLQPSHRMRIAIVHIGAPAAGMNTATRAAVNYCLARGHTPIAIHNGFLGLVRHHASTPSSVRPMTWLETDAWVNTGGSEIGVNRKTPMFDMQGVASCFERYKFDAMFIIGGFEAFKSLSELRKAREQFPSLRVPMILLPATISNNVPGTEYSLGSDTCLNSLVNFCDVIRQSASSSRRRVFVVETQGGKSGCVATLSALAAGAYTAYIPEEHVSLEDVLHDVRLLKKTFDADQGKSAGGKLIIRNEAASKVYTTQVLADILKLEGKGRFDTRAVNPGHFQQGDKPSPIDRIRSVRMAIKCIEHLESFAGLSGEEVSKELLTSAVIGIRGSEVVISPMSGPNGLEENETDWENRIPKKQFWTPLKEVVDIMGGRTPRAVGK
ncbi:phosphofructokinase subunit [Ascosphaera apis ARSEF 7405]|uniref:ATP-dependent 6-phosphofructokinase n=1 Tax=Ascosphaera apis ARSEF 7405 TaxID=392613 RepID=A0A167UWN9_9EURO|nr:phosphofructokinase subunit [Ascosphaera apis ARSEF 7405]